jgi:hypothetical protein
MTDRDLTKELLYTNYVDMDNGDDVESIDYRSLIHILTELMSRVEKLEAKEDLEPKPEGSLKFQLGKSLEDILYDWWSDVFVSDSDLDLETSISDLVDRIELFLPKPQSASVSESVDAVLMVKGWNNCLIEIGRNLR